jgi:hypothetical protein
MPGEPQKNIASVKGTEAFERWLDGLRKKTGAKDKASLIWLGFKTLAVAHGYDEPMPER